MFSRAANHLPPLSLALSLPCTCTHAASQPANLFFFTYTLMHLVHVQAPHEHPMQARTPGPCRAHLAMLCSSSPRPPLCLARAHDARATRRHRDGTAHCRRHHAMPPTPASPPRPRRCSVLAGFAASALAPSVLPLFALTTSCRSPRRCRPCAPPPLLSSPIKGARP